MSCSNHVIANLRLHGFSVIICCQARAYALDKNAVILFPLQDSNPNIGAFHGFRITDEPQSLKGGSIMVYAQLHVRPYETSSAARANVHVPFTHTHTPSLLRLNKHSELSVSFVPVLSEFELLRTTLISLQCVCMFTFFYPERHGTVSTNHPVAALCSSELQFEWSHSYHPVRSHNRSTKHIMFTWKGRVFLNWTNSR